MNGLPTEARTGRQHQRYTAEGIRQVAVAIPIDPETKKVLIISSSKYANVWVLPKGGWESDETQEEAAKRETYEEAGVVGDITSFIGNDQDYTFDGKPKTYFWIYEIAVREIMPTWPEDRVRKRRWCTFDEAIEALTFKSFMQNALRKSSIAPPSQV
ncbi:NUDIX hydrolase domain-like protein [Phascolomyces articulosus]|uniref:NUDIX hydrolase domain-like protein n=1 Tax=Phascolomyces articulosus TaxID=60185 RepID=A0AAD5JYI0_9FUNG|nr:NUDIX hydrolase domain-like protein [Phascolomyces articulosus]